MSLHIASDLITEVLHAAAAHARSTFLLLDLNSKRSDQKFDASAKIVDCKPVELEQLFSVTSDGCLLAKSKSRELIASILGVTLECRLWGYVFQRKVKHRMLAFNSEIEITSETNGNWYIEQLLAKPNVAFRCTHLESLVAGFACHFAGENQPLVCGSKLCPCYLPYTLRQAIICKIVNERAEAWMHAANQTVVVATLNQMIPIIHSETVPKVTRAIECRLTWTNDC